MILHVDMDAFFASVEQRDNPELKGKPVVVGGNSKRSVVSAASYEARKYGIRSAMPIFKAKQECKNLCIVPVNMKKYIYESKKIMDIFMTYSPFVEQTSVDEAYIDIKGCERLFGDHTKIIMDIKNRIKNERSLTCSIGAAPIRFLAKIASDINKPDGIFIIEQEIVSDFVKNIDIKKISGVGKKTYEQMKILNIKKLGDVQKFSSTLLQKKFGTFGTKLVEYSNCIDTTPIDSTVSPTIKRKSISSESTLSKDTNEIETIKNQLLLHSKDVGRQLRKKDMMTNNVAIKFKFSDFSQVTRQKTITAPISSTQSIYRETLSLLSKIEIKKKIRLVGVNVACLNKQVEHFQLELLNEVREQTEKWEKVDKAIDSISEKFGTSIIKNATLKD
ncbi:MAG: DNA polymerase IV [Desulfobacteraceae bacterium]|nr:DNA polymerase IV [Desulfobacteraceae bacterium]